MYDWDSQHIAAYHHASKQRTMSVTGQGTITAKPDTVFITLGIRTESEIVSQALSENAARANNMIQALKAIGIKDEDIDTASFSIYPKYEYKDGKSLLVGYEVEHIFDITVKDVNKAGIIYETAVANGANIARNIQFELSNPEIYYEHALADALRNAVEKAVILGRTLGISVQTIPLKIKEETAVLPQPRFVAKTMVLAEQGAPPIQTQDIVIKATVQAIFEY
ncbi:MAG TPA: SIMPL domain-containing protein [Anoxybacillus sp.]|nr:SIMPL domain-containing protein [Anoxybacillus sp.]